MNHSIVFHEKTELQWYLDNGYAEEDIRSGRAHTEKYNEAHWIATEETFKLYQFVSERFYSHRLPMTIVYITQPTMEENSLSWFLSLLDHPDQLSVKDVVKGLTLFEMFGGVYSNRTQMLQKCEQFIVDCKGKYYREICDFFQKNDIS